MVRTQSRRFANDPELAVLVDKIARRYGVTPFQVLDMDPEQLGICLVCMVLADDARHRMVKQLQSRSGKSFVPVPVPTINIGDL